MADNATNNETQDRNKQIEDIYDSSYEAQKAKLKGQYDQQKADYDSQLSKAGDTYNPLRNDAYTQNAMAERSRKEAVANMGLSGGGGTSQTLQQRNTGALLGTLGDISLQQQDYTDNINLALSKLGTQLNSDLDSAFYQSESDKAGALLQQGNWDDSFGLQQDQFDLTKSSSTFDQAYTLLKAGRISKTQFEEMTGYDIK